MEYILDVTKNENEDLQKLKQDFLELCRKNNLNYLLDQDNKKRKKPKFKFK